jgi:hypothetical protein
MDHLRTVNGEGAFIVDGIPRGSVDYVLNISHDPDGEVARGIVYFEAGIDAAMESRGPITVRSADGTELTFAVLSWSPDRNEADVKIEGPIPGI